MNNEGKVKCLECGNYYKQITWAHISTHNMTMKEYRFKYNNPILIAEESKNTGDKNPFYGKRHPDEVYASRDYEYMRGDTNPAKRDDVRFKVSKGVKNSYTAELRKIRSDKTKEVRANESPEKRKQRSDKLIKSMVKSGHWVDPSLKREFDRYKQEVLKLTERQFKLYKNKIENSEKRGQMYCLDHKYSIYDGFHNNVDPIIISHWKNFEIMTRSANAKKHTFSSIAITQLQKEIKHA